jgi:predicted metalloprotease with PDZ domain
MKRALILVALLGCTPEAPKVTAPAAIVPTAPIAAPAQDGRASYRVTFPDVQGHLVEIEGRFETQGRAAVSLMLPSWIPGSYMIREFARQIETIAAFDASGAPLPIEKSAKNRFVVACAGKDEIVVRYRVYAREPSVRTSFVDPGYALLNPVSLFLADDEKSLAYAIQIVPAPSWPGKPPATNGSSSCT